MTSVAFISGFLLGFLFLPGIIALLVWLDSRGI